MRAAMDLAAAGPSVHCGENVEVTATEIYVGHNVKVGDNAHIDVRRLVLEDNTQIDHDVTIQADTFKLGHGSRIEARSQIAGMKSSARMIRIGEQSMIGHDCKLLAPVAVIGDYVSIHNHTLLNGRKPLVIGHNCWIGQCAVLNSEDHLTIGNNVCIGIHNSIFTHGYFGDLLEGCQVFKKAPVILEDDVWLMAGSIVISPGVTLGEKALILTGSNVIKDVSPNHTVGGFPAKDLTDRFVPYREVTPDEKLHKIREFLREYMEEVYPSEYEEVCDGFSVNPPFGRFRILILSELDDATRLVGDRPLLVFTKTHRASAVLDDVTVFDLERRQYTRTRSQAEVSTISFLKSYRARFVPADQPRIELPEKYKGL